MLQFLHYREGCKPGKKRPSETSKPQSEEKKRKYEEHRPARTFNESWKANRSWLVFDDSSKLMKCTLCAEFYKGPQSQNTSNLFITGSKNLRKSAVTDHEGSAAHQKASQSQKAKSQGVGQSRAGAALRSLQAAERQKLGFLFRNAHAVGKQNRPMSDFIWMSQLDAVKNPDLNFGSTYMNSKACHKFISCLAGVECEKTTNLLDEARFFSFVMDGSTDISGDEQETIYLRTTHRGKITMRFLSIGSPKSTSASDLYDHVRHTLKASNISEGNYAIQFILQLSI